MRHLISLCEASLTNFVLQPALDPKNYLMTNSLAAIDRWRAITYQANSGGKVGVLDTVGYVMISLKDNTIVPIARGDEHHTGFDVLVKLARKHRFNANDYLPIWAHGNNYIYDQEEIPKLLVAVTKYLAYGGQDGPLSGSNDLHGKIVTLSYFVQSKGQMAVKPKQLAPIGQAVLEAYQRLAAAKEAARTTAQRSIRAKAFLAANECLNFLTRFSLSLRDVDHDQLAQTSRKLKELRANDDIDGLDQLFFGFHSIKNKIHNQLREMQQRVLTGKKPEYNDMERRGVWGDVDQAIDMLGRF